MMIGFIHGSFDPFINGHLELVKRASRRCDKVIVGIAINPLKVLRGRRFDRDVMKEAMIKVFEREGMNNVTVIVFNDFTLRIALNYNVNILIRGIRNDKDRRYEERLAKIYKKILGLETTFFYSPDNNSSTKIMEKLKKGKDVRENVPPEIYEVIKKKWWKLPNQLKVNV